MVGYGRGPGFAAAVRHPPHMLDNCLVTPTRPQKITRLRNVPEQKTARGRPGETPTCHEDNCAILENCSVTP